MASYLVTGGAGFIGSHIVEELIRRQQRVKVIDNFSTGKRENLDFAKNVEVINADLSTSLDLRQIFAGVDYVIHQGAIPSGPKSMIDPVISQNAIVNGPL